MNKQEIIDYYNDLCELSREELSRLKYRSMNPKYSSSLIESIFGSWNDFVKEAKEFLKLSRYEIQKVCNKNKAVVSYISDGASLNLDFFLTLKYYAEVNDADLYILWGKASKGTKTFTKYEYEILSPYLVTEVNFAKDKHTVIKDFLIPITQKNPLINLDKLSTFYKTIVVGSTKQYLKILPYKQYTSYRVACSTGSLGEIDYKDTVAGCIDAKYHTFGAILLEYSESDLRYKVRNLVYKNDCIIDLNKKYSKQQVTDLKSSLAMVLGDLHLPDEDEEALNGTMSQIDLLKPKFAMIHDIASWNSISHHDFNNHLSKVKNTTEYTSDLKTELSSVLQRLDFFTSCFPNVTFKIVNSNHDNFIVKWLEKGEFIKDSKNAVIGAELFVKYTQNHNILEDKLPDNVELLNFNESFNIGGFELSEHGDSGISGANGSINAFSKTFSNSIIGHTHSPELKEDVVVVGTLSKLKLNYNQKGMTTWAHCNAVIYENNTTQLLFL